MAAEEGQIDFPVAVFSRSLTFRVETGNRTRALLANINLSIPSGNFVAIIGPSGCGKSTLVKVLSGILEPTSGELRLAGYDVQYLKQNYPLATGYLPQFGAFHEDLTIREILQFAAALRLPKSVSNEIRNEWITYVVKLSGIEKFLNQSYRTLSGGQMRRVALAEELIGDPPFLFLDELTSGLDPHSELEMMQWLEELARKTGKTIVLVTHSLRNIELCDSIIFMSEGRMLYHGPYSGLLERCDVATMEELYAKAHDFTTIEFADSISAEPPQPQFLKTARPPGGFQQFFALFHRQMLLLARDRGQLILQLILIVSFPLLVAIFGYSGLPGVRKLSLGLESNVIQTLTEQLLYSKELFHSAALISGLAMFQVILLTLMGANNGAREIAKEKSILDKELRVGLSTNAYTAVKFLQVAAFSAVQAIWMTLFVKTVCGFSGSILAQVAIFFATTFSMSCICLTISARSSSVERASLSAIYLVGLQLPLSGAVLALPELISWVTRPFISAYWGWSGYLRTLSAQQYDIVNQTTETQIALWDNSLFVLMVHVLLAFFTTQLLIAQSTRS